MSNISPLQFAQLQLRLIDTQMELLRYQRAEVAEHIRALQTAPVKTFGANSGGLNLDGGPANPPGPP